MNKEEKFMKVNLSFGHWLYHFMLLQLLPILFTLKGAIILGLFPSIASLTNVFYQWIVHKRYDLPILKEFSQFYNAHFWETNKIGWAMSGAGFILLFDLYISSQFIQSIILHALLLFLLLIFTGVFLYLFPIYARYDFEKSRDYMKQSFFISLSSIVQTIAALLAIVVVSYIFQYIPFVLLFFGIPVLFGSVSWFVFQGVSKAEKMSAQQKTP